MTHPRNKHQDRYDFKQLIASCPALAPYVRLNPYNDESIEFSNPDAVKMLNTALLKHFYDIDYWEIPKGYLCPPIPGRADYIHHVADVLGSYNGGRIPTGRGVTCLDVGVGANCVYPIVGNKEYGWSFLASDVDPVAIASAENIIARNSHLTGAVQCRLQPNPRDFFKGVVREGEHVDVSVCNPPFHASLAEAQAGTLRKLSNLNNKIVTTPTRNFGGQHGELWCDGGEVRFVTDMVQQSRQFAQSCFLFSSLLSRLSNLKSIYDALKRAGALDVRTTDMGQGNKISRIVTWTFLTPEQRLRWVDRYK